MNFATVIYWLTGVGLALLPFSTAAKGQDPGLLGFLNLPQYGVFHLGIPFLALAALFSVAAFVLGVIRVPQGARVPVALASGYMLCVVGFTLLAPDPLVSATRAAVNVVGFGVFLGIVGLADEQVAWRRITEAIVLSGVILSVYFTLNIFAQSGIHGETEIFAERYVGGIMSLPWGASNTIASTLLFPLILTFAEIEANRRKTWNVGCATAIIVAILLTLSRNAILCVALFLVVYHLWISRARRLTALSVLAITGVLVSLTLDEELMSFILRTRFESMQSLMMMSERGDIWTLFLQEITTNPLSPVGYYGSLATFSVSPHNWLLLMYVEMGPIGLALSLGLFIVFALRCVSLFARRAQATRQVAKVFVLGLVVIFLNVQAEDPEFTHPYIIYFWTFLAAILTFYRSQNRTVSAGFRARSPARSRAASQGPVEPAAVPA